mgnify:FL=1
MVGYSPIDFDDPIEVPVPRKKEIVVDAPRIVEKVPIKPEPEEPVTDEDTECNFLVFFFIVGVVALAAMDSAKR